MTKNPAEIAGTRYKNEKLMSRVQKTDGTSRCFAQIENIKRQSLSYFHSLIPSSIRASTIPARFVGVPVFTWYIEISL